MKETVEWLLKTETLAAETYREAADFLSEDRAIKDFLIQLSDDEAWHYHMLETAAGETSLPFSKEYALNVDAPLKQRIEAPFHTAKSQLMEKALTKDSIIETVMAAEFSEWNNIFVYVIDSLKHNSDGFRSIAPKMQHHIRCIEHFIERLPDASRFLPRIRSLPSVWEERILVVDDFEPITEILKALLQPYGIVDTAANGAEGLQKALDQYYAAIISDVNMPVMSGPELYRSLSNVHPNVGRRFLFLSGNPTLGELAFFKREHLLFLEKPAALGKIKQTVFGILDTGAGMRTPRAIP